MNKQHVTHILQRGVKGLVLFVAIYLFVTSLPVFIGWNDLFGTAGAKTIGDAISRVILGIGLVAALAVAKQITQ